MHPLVVFVRHGQTNWNRDGRLQGQQDIPLNDLGRGEAKRNGEAIRAAIPNIHDFDFVASPLVRTRETMEIIRLSLGLDPSTYHLDDRLREITFGHWEGLTTAELSTREPDLVAAREKDKWGFEPPGGESYKDLSDRVDGWFDEITRPTVAIAHGGIGRVLRKRILDIDPHEAVVFDFPQDRVLVLEDHADRWL